jgi:hypothetical protein
VSSNTKSLTYTVHSQALPSAPERFARKVSRFNPETCFGMEKTGEP